MRERWQAAVLETLRRSITLYATLFGLDRHVIAPPIIEEEEHTYHRYAFLSPVVRRHDPEIFAEIIAADEKRRRPVRIVEVGAGRTWCPTDFGTFEAHNYNAPWLARALMADRPDLRYLATDLLPTVRSGRSDYREYTVLFVPPKRRQLFSTTLTVSATVAVPVSSLTGDTLRPIAGDELRATIERAQRADEADFQRWNTGLSTFIKRIDDERWGAAGRHFIRPSLDREVEKKFFSLRVLGQISAEEITAGTSTSYDLIVARHQGSCQVLRRLNSRKRRFGGCCYTEKKSN